jgi:hypothetical protein
MNVLQGVTLAIAILGATLGVITTWHSLDQSRVKLKVLPAMAIPVGAAPAEIDVSVTVTNLSAFPITVNEVGVLFRGLKDTDKRGVMMNPLLSDNGPWPRRLESRSSVSLFASLPDPAPGLRIRCAYARTDCGKTVEGNSSGLQSVARGRGL